MRVQVERAKMLLIETDMSVEQIAKCTGFAAFAYFVRAFRRETGITPRVYRKNSRVTGLRTAAPQGDPFHALS
jgi:transcriptional regulator GlxA family with amidase domain